MTRVFQSMSHSIIASTPSVSQIEPKRSFFWFTMALCASTAAFATTSEAIVIWTRLLSLVALFLESVTAVGADGRIGTILRFFFFGSAIFGKYSSSLDSKVYLSGYGCKRGEIRASSPAHHNPPGVRSEPRVAGKLVI